MKYLKLIRNIPELLSSLQAMWNTKVCENKYHVQLAGKWLLYSQTINNDGGYAHSYSLYNGWERSYPETTGYIIPTMISLGKYLNDDTYTTSALNAGKWLLDIQQADGSFLDLSGKKQIFDTGQILEGLLALYNETTDKAYISAAIKTGDFLIHNQDADGKWTSFSYNKSPHSYYSRVAANLLKLFDLTGVSAYKTAAEMNLNWTMQQQKKNGYFDFMSFIPNEHPYLHTIVYVLEGLWDSYTIVQRNDIFDSLKKGVDALLLMSKEQDVILYARYDENWRYVQKERCPVGLAQWAGLLLNLFAMTHEQYYYDLAAKTIQYLKSKQIYQGSNNITGAIPGSVPLWGNYFGFTFTNWTVKFFIDALLRLEQIRITGT